MGKKAGIVDFAQVFRDSPNATVVANNGESARISLSDGKELLSIAFSQKRDNNFVASCSCGKMVGNFYLGMECTKCYTPVRTNSTSDYNSTVFIEIPDIMPPVLNPNVYLVLSKWLGTHKGIVTDINNKGVKEANNTSILDALLDTCATLPPALAKLPQGFINFHKQFYNIVNFFCNDYKPFQKKLEKNKAILLFLKRYRDVLFTRHLPILNDTLHYLEPSGTRRFVDPITKDIINAMITISNATHSYHKNPLNKTHDYLDKSLFDVYMPYNRYIKSIREKYIFGKRGFLRKFISGSRCHFTFRGVIVPIIGKHHPRELHLPWAVGVTGLKLELYGKLVNKLGFKSNKALQLLHQSQQSFSPIIADLLRELVAESPFKTGLPVLFGRNPSIRHGANQRFLARFKEDPHDYCAAISPYALTAGNIDFDGDQMYGVFLKENKMAEEFKTLRPATTLLDGAEHRLSDALAIPTQIRLALHTWILSDDDPDVLDAMGF